ncbi:YchJ family protein [Flavobacterium sp. W22_SRS_FP1]|uniref:YchJ family protein n=1 Tax=Flavobacterium sp. W22_SRS_FP1 TaxID=3240276 RepID=UPI003F8DA22A
MKETECYCGSQMKFNDCCNLYINASEMAPTAESLMRSRYSAYATHNAGYLVATTHPSTRINHNKKDILEWSQSNQWIKLEIIHSRDNKVEFKAFYLDSQMQMQMHHEHSTFKVEDGKWFYVDGEFY